MRICYIRHADHKDDKLTCLGKKQVKLIVPALKEENIKVIYCSPTNRCLETAKIIAKSLNVEIRVRDNLNERFKTTNPSTKDEIDNNENYLNYNFISKDKNILTCKHFIDRNFSVFDEIVKNHLDKKENVLIVAHSSTLYALNAYICGIPSDGYIKWLRASNCAKVCYEKE